MNIPYLLAICLALDLALSPVAALAATPEAQTAPAPQKIPATPEEVMHSWSLTAWVPAILPGSYFYSGFKSETTYGDLKIKPTNPPPFRPEAQVHYDKIRQAAQDGKNLVDITADCSDQGFAYNIVQGQKEFYFSPDHITILYRNRGIQRIWTDGRPHPKEIVLPQSYGHSIGHWDGNALVIDTVGLRGDRFIEPGLVHSDQLHMVVRLTPVADDRIRVDVTFDDPINFTRPWTAVEYLKREIPQTEEDRDFQFLEFTCENNRTGNVDGVSVLLGPDGKPLGGTP
ncbi:MAG: hypothetical protein QM696_00975 [Steroidobacteraceae bacterium]